MTGDPRSMVGPAPDPRPGPQRCRDALEAARARVANPQQVLRDPLARVTACAHPYVEAASDDHWCCTRCGTLLPRDVPPDDEPQPDPDEGAEP